MEKISINRTGDSKLCFSGELIASADSQGRQGPSENRYFELAVYCTEASGYVGSIAFRTHWQGETDQDFARALADAGEVRKWFTGFDPCNPELWRGIPENVHDAERRNSYYRNAITTAYRIAVSEILAADEFTEVL